jgi:hypothetical protein
MTRNIIGNDALTMNQILKGKTLFYFSHFPFLLYLPIE